MKNIPEVIYLNVGEITSDEFKELDFNNLVEVTCSQNKIHAKDIKYILSKRNFRKRRKVKV